MTRAALRRVLQYDLRGKVVLITGGSRGLGLVLAREFAREGAYLAICALDEDELERARADLVARTDNVFETKCDVTDQLQVEEMMALVRDRYGHVDVLVNNAGVIQVGHIEVMTLKDFEDAMNTHFWGAPLYDIGCVAGDAKTRTRADR